MADIQQLQGRTPPRFAEAGRWKRKICDSPEGASSFDFDGLSYLGFVVGSRRRQIEDRAR